MRMRLGAILALTFVVTMCWARGAFAHGEAADEPFLKDLTVAFYDVHVSPTSIKVGEPVTVTGSLRVLETWPYTLDPPETAYITPVVPGPVFTLRSRVVNGEEAPGSILVEKGGIYQFKMELLGRNPGHWHVHPGIAIQGTGTLIGPGEWVTIEPSGEPFKMDISLLNGHTINLERYGGRFVWWWSLAGFIIGVIWMIYWTVPKRTVTRLAVTAQLGVNDDAPDIGLITARDHLWMDVLAGVTIVMLIVGWVYMAYRYPVRLPQQTVRFAPEPLSAGDKLAEVRSPGSTYDDKTDTLVMKLEVKNTGANPLNVKDYIMAMTTFVNGDKEEQEKAGPAEFVGKLKVEPDSAVAPGASATLTLTMSNDIFDQERLVPLHDPQQLIAGLVRVQDTAGHEQLVTVKSTLVPTEFAPQYLP